MWLIGKHTLPSFALLIHSGFLAIKSTVSAWPSCLLVHKCRYIQLVHTRPSHLMKAEQQLSRTTCPVSECAMKGNDWSHTLFLCFKALNGRFLHPLSLSCGSLRFVSSSFKVLKQTCWARFINSFCSTTSQPGPQVNLWSCLSFTLRKPVHFGGNADLLQTCEVLRLTFWIVKQATVSPCGFWRLFSLCLCPLAHFLSFNNPLPFFSPQFNWIQFP